jgi:hypothetical protein
MPVSRYGRHGLAFNDETKRAMAAMYATGAGSEKVGRKFGCSNVSVLKIIREVSPGLIRHIGGVRPKEDAPKDRVAVPPMPPSPVLEPSSFIHRPREEWKAMLMSGRATPSRRRAISQE